MTLHFRRLETVRGQRGHGLRLGSVEYGGESPRLLRHRHLERALEQHLAVVGGNDLHRCDLIHRR
jgi:hypothetical protein